MTPKQPDDADPPLLAEASSLFLQSRFDEAIAACTRHIDLHPDDVIGYMRRTLIFEHAERFEEAVADWDEVLALRPGSPVALFHRGRLLCDMDRYEEAIQDLNAAEKMAPSYNSDSIPFMRARCLAGLRRFDEAMQDLDRIPDDDALFARHRDELREWISHRRS